MVKNVKSNEMASDAIPFQLEVGENENGKYISLPLSYEFEFLPGNDKKKPVTVSSVVSSGTKTIIKTSGSTSQWRLKITDTGNNQKKESGHDNAGNSEPLDDDENDDRPGIISSTGKADNNGGTGDWFWENIRDVDENTRQLVLNARKSIIIQEESS